MNAFLNAAVPHLRLVHDFKGPKHLRVAPRQILDHALLYVERGTGTCTSVQTEPIGPGCLILVPPLVPHQIDLADPGKIHMLNIHFDPSVRPDSERVGHYLLNPANPRPRGDAYPELVVDRVLVLPLRLPAAYVSAFHRLWRQFPATDTPGRLRLRAAMLELLAIVVGECNRGTASVRPDPRLEAARLYLAGHPGPVLLREVAKQTGMGRSAFAAAFAAQFGLSPMAWHRRHRIERAKLDLLEGNQPVKAVAERWGFHSAAHFTRIFTDEVGIPPARWFKQERAGWRGPDQAGR